MQTPHNADAASVPDASSNEDRLAAQVKQTDDRLKAWREISVRRRAEWDTARQEALAIQTAKRRRVVRTTALALASAALLGLVAGAVFVHYYQGPVVREGTGQAQRLAALHTESLRPAPKAAPAQQAPAMAPPAAPAPAAALILTTPPRVWQEGSHTWAAFQTADAGVLTIMYVDAAGNPALEPMACQPAGPDGLRTCAAGRSPTRLTRAITHEGAAPGQWTARACGPQGCVDIGQFEVAAN